MLTIRRAQIEVFAKAARDNFVERMITHLRGIFTEECAQLGDARLRELIEAGIDQAGEHGIQIEDDVAKYLTLCVALGRDFEHDPQYPWARAILNNTEIDEPSAKAHLLYDAALEFARQQEEK